MMTPEVAVKQETRRFQRLVEIGALTEEELHMAGQAAVCRGIALERVLSHECHIPRRELLDALSHYHRCPAVEYDERLPVPAELLAGLDGDRLCMSEWFPIIKEGETVIIAANNPQDPLVLREVKEFIPGARYEFWVALGDDVQAFIQDFLHSDPEHLVGNERTGLAFWRNTMARWRTRLACYRTDFAKAKTNLSLLRGGLGLIAIVTTAMRINRIDPLFYLYWLLIGLGFSLVILGLSSYRRIKRSIMSPPQHQTLVEVTAATLHFLENYQFVEDRPPNVSTRKTMLARLADSLPRHRIFIEPSHDNKERSYLAHKRNLMAAQRVVAACYRTLYARARMGLSFIRTGVAFTSIGFALVQYFGFTLLSVMDSLLIASGIWMIIDGAMWYLPVRKEQSEFPKYFISLEWKEYENIA